MDDASAAVLTVSDGVHDGRREDRSGPAVTASLVAAGLHVSESRVAPDDVEAIAGAIRDLAGRCRLVVTTGGTGLGPRDVTPEATRSVLDREVPGLAEAMRAAGRASTPMADLSRAIAGSIGRSLVVNLPGSERGAVESLGAVLPVVRHALAVLAGDTEHAPSTRVHPRDAARPARHPDRDLAAEATRRARGGEPVVIATAVAVRGDPPCRPGQKVLLGAAGAIEGTLGCAEFDAAAAGDAPRVLAAAAPERRTYAHDLGEVDVYLEPQLPPPRLVVVGATPVALWLLRWARDVGYDTVLVEAAAERITSEHRAVAGTVASSPDALVVDGATDVVHTDHEAPDVAAHLAALVRAGARFVGLMGSARHASPHLEALAAQGLSPEEVARVRTPVGLDVGARTPQEIALSIVAGLVAAREGRPGGWLDRRDRG